MFFLIMNKKDFLFEMTNSLTITLNHKINNNPNIINNTNKIHEFLKKFDYWIEKSNYYFLVSNDWILLSHPNNELIWLKFNASTFVDNTGYEFWKAIMEIAKTKWNWYITYNWPKKTNFDIQVKKITYIQTFWEKNRILGTWVYIDDIEKLVNNTAWNIITHTISILIIISISLLLIIKIWGNIEKAKNLIEKDYSSLAEHLSIWIFRLALRNTVYPIMQNTAMLKIFWIDEKDRKNMEKWKIRLIEFIKEEKVRNFIFSKVMNREIIDKIEFEIINAKWKSLWVNFEWKVTQIWNELFYDWIFEDITKTHKTHELLEKSYEKLKKADILKNEIIWITWHELRTPLTIIKWFASILQNEQIWDFNFQQNKYINKIINNSDKLLLMINNMLDLSKLEAWEIILVPEKIKLKEFIMWIYNDFLEQVKKEEKTLNINIPEEEIIIEYDSQHLEHVIINLISNAIKFTKPKYWIIDIIIKKNIWNTIEIIIKDNWKGISKNNIEDIFIKFKQIWWHMKRTTEWTGLWLAIVKVILEQMWTDIHVKSKLWEWSEFYFTLKISSQ